MDVHAFEEAVRSFANKPIDVDRDSGRLIAEIHDTILEVELHTKLGSLYCVESSLSTPAGKWLIERLGRFDLLAKALLEKIPEDPLLIPVQADIVDVLEKDPDATPVLTDDALAAVGELVSSPLAGMTKVVYLTSDAGEGKTSLIERFARQQAQRYLDGETHWLMLPVQLGGRPFIRLDDVIIGTLANRLRFPYYYYDSVIELVKLNALVLALDGFEEMFVVTRTGEAVSSLGSLVSRLDSKGRLLVAARSAYYEYRDFEAQAKLFKSIHRDADVSFSKVALRRWGREQFLDLTSREGLSDGECLYDTLAGNLGTQHPLLTRAVLARKLIHEYAVSEDRNELIRRLSQATGERYFEEFVTRLIEREAYEKWLDRSGEAAKPLLSVEGHHVVLTAIAEEMWQSSTTALNGDLLEDVTEITVEDRLNQTPEIVRQARERITQHALLTQQKGTRLYEFDHDEFRNFYLGRHLGTFLRDRNQAELRSFINVNDLPELAVRVSIARLFDGVDETPDNSSSTIAVEVAEMLSKLAEAGRRSSFLRSNAGDVTLAVLGAKEAGVEVEVHDLHVDADRTAGRSLSNVTFRGCFFERFCFDPDLHNNLRLINCTVNELVLPEGTTRGGIIFDKPSLPTILSVRSKSGTTDATGTFPEDRRIYDPEAIRSILISTGFDIGQAADSAEPVPVIPEEDLELRIVDRVIRYFQRATMINESTFIKRLGTWWPEFESKVLPVLLSHGVLVEVPYQGSAQQRRFRLVAGFDKLERARRAANGSFERFVEALPAIKG